MPATAEAMAESGKALVQRFVRDFWNGRDLGLADTCISSNYVRTEIGSSAELRGPGGLKQLARRSLSAFPDLHLAIEDLLCDGDKVAGIWTFTGTHIGELYGYPATRRIVNLSGMSIVTIANGKFVRETVFSDVWGMMKQLGAVAD